MSKVGVLVLRKLFESGDAKRLAKQKQDVSDLVITKDIAYLDDGDRGHLLDIYRRHGFKQEDPVVINIHGGGLFASYKEVNVNFNYEWARRGFTVISISYRRIPETTLWHQIDDVMNAFRFIVNHADDYQVNCAKCYLSGDSAGALLGVFAAAINTSLGLQKIFRIEGTDLNIRALGLISIMLDTQRKGFLGAINDVVTGMEDKGKAYETYLLDPIRLLGNAQLPPCILITSEEDLIQKDTLKLQGRMVDLNLDHQLINLAKGNPDQLIHVFSVCYPMYPKSQEVLDAMRQFFNSH